MELDTILRPSTQSQVNRPPRAPPTSVPPVPPLPTLPSTVLEPSSRTSKKELTCNNCKSQGLRATSHTDGTCFQRGGVWKVVEMLKGIFVLVEYFKELEEESIQDNFVIIYELMDEMMDFGYPQTTESKILQEYITQESHKLEV